MSKRSEKTIILHRQTKKHQNFFASAVSAVVFGTLVSVACGPFSGPLEPGFTECGGVTCQPGQYCFGGGICDNGCTSDANCREDSACENIDDFDGVGTCEETGRPPRPTEGGGEGEGEGEPQNTLQACTDACDRFADCGMQGSDYNDCLNTCPNLNDNQRRTVARCAEGSCADSRNCLEIDCFNDGDCGGDEQCLGGNCFSS